MLESKFKSHWGGTLHYLMPVLFTVSAIGTTHCGRTILAEFKGGTINDQELQLFSRMVHDDHRRTPRDPHSHERPGSVEEKSAILHRLADIRIAATEAARQGQSAPGTAAAILSARSDLEAFMMQIPQFYDQTRYHMVEIQHLFRKHQSETALRNILAKLNSLQPEQANAYIAGTTELPGFEATAGQQVAMCASCENRTQAFLIDATDGVPLGHFVRIPDPIAGGHWFARRVAEHSIEDSQLGIFLTEQYQLQKRRFVLLHGAQAKAPRSVPTQPNRIYKAAQDLTKFYEKEQSKQPERSAFLALTFEKLAKAKYLRYGLAPDVAFSLDAKQYLAAELPVLFGANPDAKFTVGLAANERRHLAKLAAFYLVWKDDPLFQKAQSTEFARIWKSIRKAEQLAQKLFEKEAAATEVRRSEIETLYKKHRSVLGNLPGLPLIEAELQADIEHRKGHVMVDRLRQKLRAQYELRVYPDRLKAD